MQSSLESLSSWLGGRRGHHLTHGREAELTGAVGIIGIARAAQYEVLSLGFVTMCAVISWDGFCVVDMSTSCTHCVRAASAS